jgi:hypothetical protein
MDPQNVELKKCSSCKRFNTCDFYDLNERTGARLKTCRNCRRVRLAREARKREALHFPTIDEYTDVLPRLWDAAAEAGMHPEMTEDVFQELPPDVWISSGVNYFTAQPDSEPASGQIPAESQPEAEMSAGPLPVTDSP